MIKKIIGLWLCCTILVFSLLGCSKGDIEEQTSNQENEEIVELNEKTTKNESNNTTDDGDENIEVDLTKLSSTMVYSEVYNIVMAPDDYIGKTIKMRGLFKIYPSQDSDKTYFAIVIPDATACCEQGFEFIWRGEHSFPEDYPTEDIEIEITGQLDTYEEDGYEYFYIVADDLTVLES